MDDTAVKLVANSIQPHIRSAYEQCAPAVQKVIDTMISEVLADPNIKGGERDRALHTVIEAMFPSMASDLSDSEHRAVWTKRGKAKESEMDREEKLFAENLQIVMDKHGLTQEQLAQRTGLTQPAISNMLNRRSRPQRRTVVRFAEALGVDPEVLWPTTKRIGK